MVLPIGITAFAADLWAQQPAATTVKMIVNSGEATENFFVDKWNGPHHPSSACIRMGMFYC